MDVRCSDNDSRYCHLVCNAFSQSLWENVVILKAVSGLRQLVLLRQYNAINGCIYDAKPCVYEASNMACWLLWKHYDLFHIALSDLHLTWYIIQKGYIYIIIIITISSRIPSLFFVKI
jgi:hypothetical protein